ESRRDRSRRFRPSPRSRGFRGSASPGGRATSPASQAFPVAVVDVAWVSIDASNGLRPRPTIALLPQPCRRRGKRFVNASRAPAQTAHRFDRRARGAGAPLAGERRSRCDSASFSDRFRNVPPPCAPQSARLASGATAKAPVFGHFRRKDRFPSGLESYLLAFAHFAPLRRAIHHGGQSSDDANECQGQPSRYTQAFGGKGGGRS